MIGSSQLHFILIANTLEEEYIMNLKILCLLYLYPMISIDMYVTDTQWYIRHHYAFYSLLKQSGYIRFDPLDSFDSFNEQSISLIKLKSLNKLNELFIKSENNNCMFDNSLKYNNLLKLNDWKPIIIILKTNKLVFSDPFDLIDILTELNTFPTIELLSNQTIIGYIISPIAYEFNIISLLKKVISGDHDHDHDSNSDHDSDSEESKSFCMKPLSVSMNSKLSNICDLYNKVIINQKFEVMIESIIKTIPWLSTTTVISQLFHAFCN